MGDEFGKISSWRWGQEALLLSLSLAAAPAPGTSAPSSPASKRVLVNELSKTISQKKRVNQ